MLNRMEFIPMHADTPNDAVVPAPPDQVVLEALKLTCESIRRHNPSPDVAAAALSWETRFARDLGKAGGVTGAPGAAAA